MLVICIHTRQNKMPIVGTVLPLTSDKETDKHEFYLTGKKNVIVVLLLRSNAGVVMSDLEVDVLDELGSSSKFLLGSPQLVAEVSPRWPQGCSSECVGWTVL